MTCLVCMTSPWNYIAWHRIHIMSLYVRTQWRTRTRLDEMYVCMRTCVCTKLLSNACVKEIYIRVCVCVFVYTHINDLARWTITWQLLCHTCVRMLLLYTTPYVCPHNTAQYDLARQNTTAEQLLCLLAIMQFLETAVLNQCSVGRPRGLHNISKLA